MPIVIGVLGIDGLKAPSHIQAFRKAQTSPASLPEFQGNVVAVQTAPYWDDELGALQQQMEKFNASMDQEAKRDPNLSRAARDEARKKALAETFTPEELKRLKGIFNGGYHYLGAAKILAPIGKAFAEAMVGMIRADERLGEMVTIPAGKFIMGNNNGSPEERPEHEVYLPTYQIGKYEVTRGEYRRFIEVGGYDDPQYWSAEGWKWKESDGIDHAGMYGVVTHTRRPNPQTKRREPARMDAWTWWAMPTNGSRSRPNPIRATQSRMITRVNIAL